MHHTLEATRSMPVKCLTCVVYAESGKDWYFEKTFNPTWDEIVASIGRLDKFRYPWVWLFTGDETEEASVDCLTVMGGEGVFWIGLSVGKYDQLRLFDFANGTHEVQVWTSDQGFGDQERHVTYDSDFVLRIAKHFAKTGEPLPEAIWEAPCTLPN
jgi:hypothetical protein